ncbi:MAG TPA: hypothetical protein VK416_13930 [Thermoanaerobaculia bacterium]|nr:hypothetical protein [Thermoanaerobaculia bacterium]
MTDGSSATRLYRMAREGYTFVLDHANVQKLKALPDFEGREEPALAEDFLRFRVETWAENLIDAGAAPGEVSVSLDPHQRKAHLTRGGTKLFSADI